MRWGCCSICMSSPISRTSVCPRRSRVRGRRLTTSPAPRGDRASSVWPSDHVRSALGRVPGCGGDPRRGRRHGRLRHGIRLDTCRGMDTLAPRAHGASRSRSRRRREPKPVSPPGVCSTKERHSARRRACWAFSRGRPPLLT
jgi:hypothetical protein